MSLAKIVLTAATIFTLNSDVYAVNPPTAKINNTTGYHFHGGMTFNRALLGKDVSFKERIKYGFLTFALLWEAKDTVKPSGEGFDIVDLGSSLTGILFDSLIPRKINAKNFLGFKDVEFKPYGAVVSIPSLSNVQIQDQIPSEIGHSYGFELSWGVPSSNVYKGPYHVDYNGKTIGKTD